MKHQRERARALSLFLCHPYCACILYNGWRHKAERQLFEDIFLTREPFSLALEAFFLNVEPFSLAHEYIFLKREYIFLKHEVIFLKREAFCLAREAKRLAREYIFLNVEEKSLKTK